MNQYLREKVFRFLELLYKEKHVDHAIVNDKLILQLNIALNHNEVYFLDPYNNEAKEKINDDIKQYAKQRNGDAEIEASLAKRILRNAFILCVREILAEMETTNQKVENITQWNKMLQKAPFILRNEEFIFI